MSKINDQADQTQPHDIQGREEGLAEPRISVITKTIDSGTWKVEQNRQQQLMPEAFQFAVLIQRSHYEPFVVTPRIDAVGVSQSITKALRAGIRRLVGNRDSTPMLYNPRELAEIGTSLQLNPHALGSQEVERLMDNMCKNTWNEPDTYM